MPIGIIWVPQQAEIYASERGDLIRWFVANVRLAGDITTPLAAMLSRQVPAGNNSLPGLALADSGFGGIDVESGSGGAQTVEQVFHLELTLAHALSAQGLGGRAFIALRHPPEALVRRWWRGTRQLFLKHLQA